MECLYITLCTNGNVVNYLLVTKLGPRRRMAEFEQAELFYHTSSFQEPIKNNTFWNSFTRSEIYSGSAKISTPQNSLRRRKIYQGPRELRITSTLSDYQLTKLTDYTELACS